MLAGEPVHVVAARLGHADPSVTLRVYAHVIQDLAPAVADTFAKASAEASEPEIRVPLARVLARTRLLMTRSAAKRPVTR